MADESDSQATSRQWRAFAYAADEWVIAYASLPISVHGIHQFAIGHAVELYLKALRTKLTGDFPGSVKRQHRIDLLLQDIRAIKPDTLPEYEIREHLRQFYPGNGEALSQFSRHEQLHYLSNIELYAVAKELVDLKYSGVPKLDVRGPSVRVTMYPNPYWSRFVERVREELDSQHARDPIVVALEEGDLTPRAAEFLLEVLGQSSQQSTEAASRE